MPIRKLPSTKARGVHTCNDSFAPTILTTGRLSRPQYRIQDRTYLPSLPVSPHHLTLRLGVAIAAFLFSSFQHAYPGYHRRCGHRRPLHRHLVEASRLSSGSMHPNIPTPDPPGFSLDCQLSPLSRPEKYKLCNTRVIVPRSTSPGPAPPYRATSCEFLREKRNGHVNSAN